MGSKGKQSYRSHFRPTHERRKKRGERPVTSRTEPTAFTSLGTSFLIRHRRRALRSPDLRGIDARLIITVMPTLFDPQRSLPGGFFYSSDAYDTNTAIPVWTSYLLTAPAILDQTLPLCPPSQIAIPDYSPQHFLRESCYTQHSRLKRCP